MGQIKRIDFGRAQGARRCHRAFYGNDEPHSVPPKDVVIYRVLRDSLQ